MQRVCELCKPVVGGGESPGEVYTVTCPTCGDYEIESMTVVWLRERSSSELAALSALARDRCERGLPHPFFISRAMARIVDAGGITRRAWGERVIVDDLDLRLPPIAERLDLLLRSLGRKSPEAGEKVGLQPTRDFPLAWTERPDGFQFLMAALLEGGLLQLADLDAAFTAVPTGRCQLHKETEWLVSVKGWNRIRELERGGAGRLSRKIFVAMCLNDEPFPEWRECQKALFAGIEGAGWEYWGLPRNDFHGAIDDEILAQIRTSRAVVVDLTGQRQSVYFEGGFAEGMQLPCVYTLRQDELDAKKVHFDKRQENFLAWTTVDGLSKDLTNRLLAILGTPGPAHLGSNS